MIKHKMRFSAGLALLLIGALSAVSHAALTQSVTISVSISNSKSILAVQNSYNFGALSANISSVSASALDIRNDSSVLIETYTVTGANATGGVGWSLASSTGTDQYYLGAMFSTAKPADSDSTWATSVSSTTLGTCSGTSFGNGTVGESGGAVSPVAGSYDRNLWFRMKTPSIVSDPSAKSITVTLGVQ